MTTARKMPERWRGRLSIPAHTHPCVRRLFELMNEKRVCVSDVAPYSGFGRDAFYDWRSETMPKVDALDAALNVIGFKLAVVPIDWEAPSV